MNKFNKQNKQNNNKKKENLLNLNLKLSKKWMMIYKRTLTKL